MKEVEAMEKLDKHERIVQYIRHKVISDHSMCCSNTLLLNIMILKKKPHFLISNIKFLEL